MLTIILLVLAFVLFILASIGIGAPRFNFIGGGLAAWVLAEIMAKWMPGR